MTGAKRNKILLVDDDEALRLSVGEQLRLHEDFITVEAGTGTEALNLAKREHFDAILLDFGLPDMDGREVCRLAQRDQGADPHAYRCRLRCRDHLGPGRRRR